MKEPLIIKKETFLNRYVELVGRERQHFSVIAVLLFSVYLCCMIFYLCYSTGDYYRGCHYCDLIWMPHLGSISEFTVALFPQKIFFYTFRVFLSKNTGLCQLSENLLGKLCLYRRVIKSLK